MENPKVNPLVMSLASGEPKGYAALYDQLGGPLYRTARAMLRTSDEAEDAVQDVFVELVRNQHRLSQVLDLDAYVFAMLRHAVQRKLKRRRSEDKHLRQLAMIQKPETVMEPPDELATALEALPAEQREVIAMKIYGGLTFAQIGEILNVSPNTAASRYRYALDKLRLMME